ncbi:glycosyltransferase family 1 protein [Neobacillus piezotolerans]|uniref:Glycosyltransferase family 1 protein n=1 Tax=Neobacillus piezotolerans TaxID=2259171 RepID=A0A3D8GMX5_9BACI|nr:glycosyltransferase family 4 protein [Neobacillus piezotolerans]RDU35622.1 glycosyltransferase family 1 protein [Neobacillus piezotolerans]
MKICHLTSVHPYTDIRINLKQCVSLAGAGHEVYLLAPNAPEKTINGVHLRPLRVRNKNRFERIFKNKRFILAQVNEIEADVYHFHDPELIFVGRELKKQGKKVVYDVHEDLPMQIYRKPYIPAFLKKPMSLGVQLVEKNASRNFDLICAATPHISGKFEKYNPQRIDVKNYPKLGKQQAVLNNQPMEEKYVCYIGGLAGDRGLYVMEEAIRMSTCSLYLAGNFHNPADKARFEKMENDKVAYLGFLDKEGVAALLGNSLAGLVVLEENEPFKYSLPVKMFEYMSAGIPVICSDFPLWREIVEKHNCGVCVNPADPKEISAAINFLHDNPTLAKKMGENGRRAVESEYNWETESKKLIEAYEQLINQNFSEEVYVHENSNARSI